MGIVFGSDLWQRPDDYQPPAIDHDDPLVMTIARAILNANPEYRDHAPSGWEYQMRGATQDSEYYAASYRQVIADHIAMAIAVRDAVYGQPGGTS